ncbi:MAG: glycosyltransferase family 2 protein [Pararhodobacter sp.]|nr:glycosyltransferase family 2 protein [Pararhodobacter sp.]
MLPFKTTRIARFHCQADFTHAAVLNIDFHDDGFRRIPFHLSLRRNEGVVVVNRRAPEGWRREIIFAERFEAPTMAVDIRFGPLGATLRLDGRLIGRFGALPRPARTGRFFLRRGFPGLGGIAHVDIRGPLVPGSLLMDCPGLDQPAGPAVNERLELLLRGLGEADAVELAGMKVHAENLRDELPMVQLAMPYRLASGDGANAREHALSCLLPGRIWQGAGESLVLRLVDARGGEHARLTLSREWLQAQFEAMARSPKLQRDDLFALQAIEHAHFAGIVDALSAPGRAALAERAAFFGLGDWLFGEGGAVTLGEGGAVPASAAPSARADARQHSALPGQKETPPQALRNRFTAAMRARPDSEPAAELAALIDGEGIGPRAARELVLGLSEWFSIHADPRALHALANARGLPPHAPRGNDIWHDSSVLPFLYCQGDFQTLTALIAEMAQPQEGWVVTPALAWVAREAAQYSPDAGGRLPSPMERLAIIRAFIDFIDRRAPDYWERLPCRALIGALVQILCERHSLPWYLNDELVWRLLRSHALVPGFWAAVDAAQAEGRLELPERMKPARATFRELAALVQAGGGDRDAIARRLDLFTRLGNVDVARYRRDLLGPSGLAPVGAALPDLADSLHAGLDPDEAILRQLAFPQAGDEPPTGLDETGTRRALRRAIGTAWQGVPRASHAALQEAVARQALELARLETPPGAEALACFAARLRPLCSGDGGFLAPALLWRLAAFFLHRGQTTPADALIAASLGLVAHWRPEHRGAILRETAPALAMSALRAAPGSERLMERLSQEFAPGAANLPGAAPAHAGPAAPGGPENPDPADAGRFVFDTLVCICSCRPNLDSRIPALRQSWLQSLRALGVPHLVFVGDGDGRREGDVVHLDAPDEYEGLPQKSLAMVRWVHDNTGFAHLLKIDDDCFLDAEPYFFSLSHMKFDYYGRPLTRQRGQMNRTWHMAKSRSERGQLELDKSPEPSSHADGGSGYALSRRAMAALVAAADSYEGQALIQRSFMEDKMVGDLLALSGITVANEDYRVAVMRRSRLGGPLVSQWENGFLPFRGSGIKLAHLDGVDRMAEVQAGKAKPVPRPKKTWPSYQPARLGARSNALELVSPHARLARAAAAPVAVVACMRNEAFMLPHFLAHYRALGVEGFLIADNGSDDGTLELLAEAPDVALFSVDTEYSHSHYGVAWQQALLAGFRGGRWSLMADADELLIPAPDWQGGGLPGLLEGDPAFADADAARVFMLDMYPKGPLADADFSSGDPFTEAEYVDHEPFLTVSGGMGPFTDAPVFTSALRHRLIAGSRAELFVAQKFALLKYRPWMRLSAGLHFVADIRCARRDLVFAHFKYNAAFRAKAVAEAARQQHFNNAEEYRNYLALVSEGREAVFDPAISVPWRECDFVRRALAGEVA